MIDSTVQRFDSQSGVVRSQVYLMGNLRHPAIRLWDPRPITNTCENLVRLFSITLMN